MIPIEINSQIDAYELSAKLEIAIQGDVSKEPSIAGDTSLFVTNFKCFVTHVDGSLLEYSLDITPLIKGFLKDDLLDKITTEAARMLHEGDV